MDWNSEYQKRLCSAEEAVSLIHAGDWVLPAHAAGEPVRLLEALMHRKMS